MKAKVLTIHWHLDNQPIYSADFQNGPEGEKAQRLATAGGDNNVRIWQIVYDDQDNRQVNGVRYLSTLSKHTQAVNVVRFDPKGSVLASAGDDGTILLWVLSDQITRQFGDDSELDDEETWKLRHACRSSVSEVYDIAWSPDSQYIIAGSMDNIARIYNATNGQCIRQLAEHLHYVQGVAWDPLNEYIATQSSDRSVHIYTLKSKNGQFSLSNPHKISRAELPSRRISGSPAPERMRRDSNDTYPQSPGPSITASSPASVAAPGTPRTSFMNPPTSTSRSHSRKSSFSSSNNRSESPSTAIPLPAVRQLGSPNIGGSASLATATNSTTVTRLSTLYHNEAFTSFFRRLTFTPDGSLLLTPSGLFKYLNGPSSHSNSDQETEETTNTVYIYTRAGLNRPPVAHLPGLKKPSLAVKCSPILYKLREHAEAKPTKHVNLDVKTKDQEERTTTVIPPQGDDLNSPVFKLQYRIIYAVATQDSVIVYDTQQKTPLCIVSNLHYATFTDLTWSPDGRTLFMTSTDGFCSVITFDVGELGEPYDKPVDHVYHGVSTSHSSSGTNTEPGLPSMSAPTPGSTGGAASFAEPASPAGDSLIPVISNVPPIGYGIGLGSLSSLSNLSTPPGTPSTRQATLVTSFASTETTRDTAEVISDGKRETESEGESKKKRRIAPTLVDK